MHAPIRDNDIDPVATAEAIVRASAPPEDERRFRFWWDDDAEEVGFRTL